MSNGRTQRRSIFCGVLLILFGALFLLHSFIPGLSIGHLFARYGPLILVFWGLAKLYDNFAAQRSREAKPPALTGGEIGILFLLLVLVAGVAAIDWVHRWNPDLDFSGGIFDRTVSSSNELPARPVKAGAHIDISTNRGNITVHAGETNELRVVINKGATALSETAAQKRLQQVEVVVNEVAGGYDVRPQPRDETSGGVHVDLDVRVPRQVSVSAQTSRGDISISDIAGPVTANSQKGDVEIRNSGGDASIELQHGDARIIRAGGNVRITGHGSEIELADVTGDASIEGEFYGPIRAHNVAKNIRFTSSRTDLTVTQLTGRMESDSGSLEISDVAGSVSLVTKEKDVTIENVAGRIHVQDRHGDIRVRFQRPPSEEVNISNDTGSVELTLPAKSSFEILAVSRSGEIRSEFENPSLKLIDEENTSKLEGKYGSRGPQIRVVTSYGPINLRKSG